MTTWRTSNRSDEPCGEAVVWIDHDRAVIVEQGADGRERVELLNRLAVESEAVFGARAVDQILDRGRVAVSGPASARTDFERTYVAVTHRPDRLIDVEPTILSAKSAA